MRLARHDSFLAALVFGGAIGALAYVYWYGTSTLAPANIDWLAKGDLATSFLGWHFLRYEPWSIPLGALHNYGAGLNASVIITDSIPLMAFLFKPFSALLPAEFQYFGIWALGCYILTGAFAYAIVGRFTASFLARLAGAALVVLVPFVTWRGVWHLSLVAQWLLLAAAWLYLTPMQPRIWVKWGVLLAVAGLVNPYLFAPVGAVWVAALLDQGRNDRRRHFRIAAITVAVVAAVLALAGTFSAAKFAGALGGYGYTQFDLLGWFDARGTGVLGSGLIRGLPDGGEGFQYLGLGGCLAMIAGFVLWLQRPARPGRHLAILIATALLLVLFAMSHRISVGGNVLVELPMPAPVLGIANVLRSSGRIAWLAGYLLLLGAIVMIATRMPRGAAIGLLALFVGLDLVDSPRQRADAQRSNTSYVIPGKAEQAALVASLPPGYTRLTSVPQYHLFVDNIEQVWGFAVAAAERDMAMNVAYLGRFDERAYAIQGARLLDEVTRGPLQPGTAYLTRNAALALKASAIAPAWSAYATVGKDIVILPAGGAVPGARPLQSFAFAAPSLELQFTTAGDGRFYLVSGWSRPERWGTWSDGKRATLLLPRTTSSSPRLKVEARAYAPGGAPGRVGVLINGHAVAQWQVSSTANAWYEVAVPPGALGDARTIEVAFEIAEPRRPALEPGSNSGDYRDLGMALLQLRLE